MQLNWTVHWMLVAEEHVLAGRAARAQYQSNPAGALGDEFRAGLVAVTAASFAIEARMQLVLGGNAQPASKPTIVGRAANAGDYLGQFLSEAGVTDPQTILDVGLIFHLRNKSVHPPVANVPPVQHPVGTNTSPEVVAFNADEAERLTKVAGLIVGLF